MEAGRVSPGRQRAVSPTKMNHGRNPQPHSSAVAEGPAGDRSAGRALGPHSHSHHGRLAKVPRWMPRWEGEGGLLSFHQQSRPPSTEAREHKLLWTRGCPAYTEVTRQTFVLSQKLFLTGISSFSSNFARMLNILIELQSSLNYESRTLEGDPSEEMGKSLRFSQGMLPWTHGGTGSDQAQLLPGAGFWGHLLGSVLCTHSVTAAQRLCCKPTAHPLSRR